MTTMAGPIEIVFFAVAAIVFAINFYFEKCWKTAEPSKIAPTVKNAFFVALPFVVLLSVGAVAQYQTLSKIPFFLGALFVPFMLRKLIASPWLRGVLLTIVMGAVTLIPGGDPGAVLGLITGLIAWKCSENLLGANPNELDDFLPPFVWLTAIFWSTQTGTGHPAEHQVGLIAGVLAVTFILRWAEKPLLHSDPVYLKRLVLSITGGLGCLIVVQKLLVGATFDNYAIVGGAGFLSAYIIESFDGKRGEKTEMMKSIAQLVLVAIITVALTRMFNTFSTLIVAATMFIAPRSLMPKVAGIYLCTRALTQAYVATYNPNVTGINLEHPYSSAALYAGFLIVIGLFVGIRELGRRATVIAAVLATCIITPIAAAFLLHAEPTAALLVSSLVAGIIVSVCGAAISKQEVIGFENLIFVPGLMTCTALLSADVLSSGEEATIQSRLIGIAIAAFAVICAWIVRKVMQKPGSTTLPAAKS